MNKRILIIALKKLIFSNHAAAFHAIASFDDKEEQKLRAEIEEAKVELTRLTNETQRH